MAICIMHIEEYVFSSDGVAFADQSWLLQFWGADIVVGLSNQRLRPGLEFWGQLL